MRGRWLFHLIAAVFLIAFVLLIAVWVRSVFSWDSVVHVDRRESRDVATERILNVQWSRGYVGIAVTRSIELRSGQYGPGWTWQTGSPVRIDLDAGAIPAESVLFDLLNCKLIRDVWRPAEGEESVTWAAGIPIWLAVLISAGPPITWWISRRRRTHRLTGRLALCPTCGYDLTANVSGTCPECGTTIQTSAGAVRSERTSTMHVPN